MKISSTKNFSFPVRASTEAFLPERARSEVGSSVSRKVPAVRAVLSLPAAMPCGIQFLPADIIKALVRAKLSDTLVPDLAKVPEVFDGLVEFFSDLVSHDPRRARLLGISYPENS